jgi:succinoglycan biosynthesis transport protein ExoP
MQDQEFDVRRVIGLLRRQFRLILTTLVLALAVAGVAVFVLKPVYTAATLVMVDPSRKDLLDPESQSTGLSSESARVESEVELARSETTILRVIDENGLINDPEFGVRLGLRDTVLAYLRITNPTVPTGEDAVRDVMGRLKGALTIQRRGLTYLISIQVRSGSPARAAMLANAVADAYIAEQLESKIDSTLASRDIIQARIAEANTAVVASEEAFDGFIDNNLNSISQQTGRTDLLDLQRQLEEADAGRLRAASVIELADRSLARRDWSAVSSALQSQAVAALEDDRARIAQSMAAAVEGSEAAIDLRAELARVEAELDTAAGAELTSLHQQVAAAQAKSSDLRVQLRSTVLSSDLPADVLTNMYALQQNAEIARTQYQTLLARANDLETQAFLQVADSRVVSRALPPQGPSFPNPQLILGLAGLGGLVLGVGLGFLRENFVGGFTSESQLQAVLRATSVASVPHARIMARTGEGEEPRSLADYVTQSPLSIFAESIRRIRVGIDQAIRRLRKTQGQQPPRDGKAAGTVVMVTSAAPNEGKTTTALSLARAYALSGRSTLLIDCDLRKPSIHKHLGVQPSISLFDYLTDKTSEPALRSIMAADDASGAQVIVGARPSDVPTDQLISGHTFSRLIDSAREAFEIVILDTPPVGPVVDGLYLAQFADVITFVIRWANTSQQDARAAVAAINDAKRPEVEVIAVLTQQSEARSSYRNKYAGYYTET